MTFLSQECDGAGTAPTVAVNILKIPTVGVGTLWNRNAIMSAVPKGEDIGRVEHEEAPSGIDEDFEFDGLAAGDGAEVVVLGFAGGEDIGEPNGADF